MAEFDSTAHTCAAFITDCFRWPFPHTFGLAFQKSWS
jgi:hypothetical protein